MSENRTADCLIGYRNSTKRFIVGPDYETVYLKCIEYIEREHYNINILQKSSDTDQYVLVKSGDMQCGYIYKEIRDKEKKSADSNGVIGEPVIINVTSLSEKPVAGWCRAEETETEPRYIWARYGTGTTHYCWRLTRDSLSDENLRCFSEDSRYFIRKKGLDHLICLENRKHDLKHDPWHPVYPDLKGIPLQKLQICPEEMRRKISIDDDERVRIEGILFDKQVIENDGSIDSMLNFGLKFYRNGAVWEKGSSSIQERSFIRTFESEQPCFDGGTHEPDLVIERVGFRKVSSEPDEWNSLVEKTELEYPNMEREEVLERWKELWGYRGTTDDAAIQVAVSGDTREHSELYLLNPFGMKGIFAFQKSYARYS